MPRTRSARSTNIVTDLLHISRNSEYYAIGIGGEAKEGAYGQPLPPDGRHPLPPAAAAGSMTRAEWRRMAGMAAFIAALHVIGWFTLVWIVTPEHYTLGEKTFGIGIGVAAHALGMRHAFDADHIADAVTAVPGGAAPGHRPGAGAARLARERASEPAVDLLLPHQLRQFGARQRVQRVQETA